MVEVKGGRILVVDRDASRRGTWARILRDAGQSVFDAGHLSDAALLRQAKPELIVLDALHDTPDIGGALVLRILAADTNHRALDADGLLVEPISPAVLASTAQALLRLGRAECALRDTITLEQSARHEANEANRIKDDFLGTVSHELRTPLHAIVGWVALMRTRPFDEDARAKALEIIERNARAETALIEDLLDVSRISLGQLRLTWRTVELAPILFSALDAIGQTAQSKGVTISTEIAFNPDIRVRGDATRLRQVFWNLLSNGVKFTPKGGHICVHGRFAEGRAEIEVTDTGRGITPELLPHMFERFGRADHGVTNSVDRGLGLGLAIAHDVIELHGGTLTAASSGVDRGATFVVSLPSLDARGRDASRPIAGNAASRPRLA